MRIVWIVSILALFAACGQGSKESTVETTLLAGASKKDITPEPGMFIAGDQQNRTFTGIHDSLYVRAVVASDGEKAVAIVSVNSIGLLYPDIQEIRRLGASLASLPGLTENRIIVTSDHIHSGPDVVGIWGPSQMETGRDSLYMGFLIDRAALAIKEAADKLAPARMRYATGEFGEGWVENISEPDEIDRSLTILQFVDSQDQSIATLTNFACHPTFYDAVHSEVSADFVGAYASQMENDLPGEHIFLQGAIGGWVQPNKEDQSFEVGQRRGNELAGEVQTLLSDNSEWMDTYDIDLKTRKFDMPVQNEGFQQLAAIGVIDRELSATTATEMAWFRIGDAQFITHPGETPPSYSLASKELMTTEPKFVLGLGLDAMGYILEPKFFEDPSVPHAEYLTRMSPGPEAGPKVMTVAEGLIPN